MAETVDPFGNIIFNSLCQPAFQSASIAYQAERHNILIGEADTLAARELYVLQRRAEDSIRNNGYAKKALTQYITNLGTIQVNWQDAKGNSHNQMQDLWENFAADPNLDGYGNLANTQSVWHSSEFVTGNSHTRMLIKRTGNPNKIPLKLQTIPSQLHSIEYNGRSSEEITRNGIQFIDTKPFIYFYRKSILEQNWYSNIDKNGTQPILNGGVFPQVEVPANEILHIFHRETPGQWIGIPRLASILIPLYEIDELSDATIAKQKAAQAIAWIIENTSPLAMTPTGSPIQVKDVNNNDKVVFKSQGGNTQYLNKGEKLTQVQSGDIGANLPVLIKTELHRIASALDCPYHSLSGDTSGLDFSSIRAIGIELRNRLEYIHHFYTIPLGLTPLCNYFGQLARLYNKKLPYTYPAYQLPRHYGVDELKDTMADVLEVQNGMATLQSKLDERHTSFEEIIADREKIKAIGLENLLNPNAQATAQSNNNQANSNSTSK